MPEPMTVTQLLSKPGYASKIMALQKILSDFFKAHPKERFPASIRKIFDDIQKTPALRTAFTKELELIEKRLSDAGYTMEKLPSEIKDLIKTLKTKTESLPKLVTKGLPPKMEGKPKGTPEKPAEKEPESPKMREFTYTTGKPIEILQKFLSDPKHRYEEVYRQLPMDLRRKLDSVGLDPKTWPTKEVKKMARRIVQAICQ